MTSFNLGLFLGFCAQSNKLIFIQLNDHSILLKKNQHSISY